MRFRLKVVEAVRSNVCSVDADDDAHLKGEIQGDKCGEGFGPSDVKNQHNIAKLC